MNKCETCAENRCRYCIERGVLIAQIDKEEEWHEYACFVFKSLYEDVPGVAEYIQDNGYMIWWQIPAGSIRRRPLTPNIVGQHLEQSVDIELEQFMDKEREQQQSGKEVFY